MPTASPNLVCIDPKRINEFWPLARELIRSAIDYTELSEFSGIERDVLLGNQLLWLAVSHVQTVGHSIEAAATTQLIKINEQKICVLTACAGHDPRRWLPLFELIEKYAAEEGCVKMRIYGRPGWQRVLQGYLPEYVILEKQLHGRH